MFEIDDLFDPWKKDTDPNLQDPLTDNAEDPFAPPPTLPYPDEWMYPPYREETGDDWIWNENDG